MRSILIYDDDLSMLGIHSLTGPHIEWNPCPSPVINLYFYGYERFVIAAGFLSTLLFKVPKDWFSINPAIGVLPSHNVFIHLIYSNWS